MKTPHRQRIDLIDALVAEGDLRGITAGLLEKDEHLTDALRALFALKFEHARFVLCGGTSLSMAHGMIDRMSEDADIKVVLSPEADAWTGSGRRRYLGGEVRAAVATALSGIGFAEDVEKATSRNGTAIFTANGPTPVPTKGLCPCGPICNLSSPTASRCWRA